VTVSLVNASGACAVIRLPRWKPAPMSGPSYDWSYILLASPSLSDWDFRQHDGGVLIGLFARAKAFQPEPRSYSPNQYAVSLPTGHVQKATSREWENAERYATVRDPKLPRGLILKPNTPLLLDGDVYRKTGPKWPTSFQDSARVSQKDSFRALNSWDGVVASGGDSPFSSVRIDGNYYVDIYGTSSKRLLLSLRGHFHDVPIDNLFSISAWISNRYYIFPLNEEADHFVLCDMSRIAPSDDRGKP